MTPTTSPMHLDLESCYRAVKSRDRRFDGVFYTAVRTTGIYCRPSCPARTPSFHHVTFHPTAAAAQAAGYRACKRCLPDATPGSPDWDVAADVAGRAMRLIADGVVDREGVDGLARHIGYTARHLSRILTQELGAGPLALARAKRAQTARVLLETTDLGAADVAFAAGFSSVRQFNETVREVYASTPTQLAAGGRGTGTTGGILQLRLAVRTPFAGRPLLEFLATRAVPGVEVATDTTYARTLRFPHGTGTVELELTDHADEGSTAFVPATFRLADLRDLAAAVERVRRLVDADCDPVAIRDTFAGDPVLGRLVRPTPGLRVPGHVDGDESRSVPSWVSRSPSAGARTAAGRLTAQHGEPLAEPQGEADPRVPDRGPTGRARARVAAHAAVARPRTDRVVSGPRRRRARAGPRRRPRRRTPRPAGDPRHRTLDRRLHRPARPGSPRRVPARPTSASATRYGFSGATRGRRRPGRAMAPLALLRPAPSLADPLLDISLPDRQKDTDMWTVMPSPVGDLRIVEHDDAITAIEFSPFRDHDGRPRGDRDDNHPVLVEASASWVRTSTAISRSSTFRSTRAGSEFQRAVWEQLQEIGYGETASYGEIAERLGKSNAASRAVGLANGRNPIPIVIPCHRVIGADGTLTGYAGGVERKQALLEIEQDALF